MNTLHGSLAYCLLAINAVAFIVYGIDKYKAKKVLLIQLALMAYLVHELIIK